MSANTSRGWDAQAAGCPCAGARDRDLRGGGARADARGQHGSCCVAAHGDRSPAVGIVG